MLAVQSTPPDVSCPGFGGVVAPFAPKLNVWLWNFSILHKTQSRMPLPPSQFGAHSTVKNLSMPAFESRAALEKCSPVKPAKLQKPAL
jgi:hypothetical protein